MVYVRKTSIRQFVTDLRLKESDRYRGDCPECRGKNTFTATNILGDIKYNCFKLGCTVGGIHGTDMTAAEIHRRLEEQQLQRAYTNIKKEKDTMEIPEYVVTPKASHTKYQRYIKRWGIAIGDTMYDVKDERVVFPIKHDGRIIDAVGRAVGKKQHPKWYRYTGEADYYTIGNAKTLLIVEDVVSAIVAFQEIPYVTAMAILGTSLSPKHMEKIGEYDKIIIALDPDAIGKTVEYRREIELWTGNKTVAMNLIDDIKYREYEDMDKLKELVNEVSSNH
tara:strand:+ start:664 stop:1497 length:834 start_codon:yes stop_codon:yes gene_type:complete